ncbi:thioredoxin-like [Mya arenaria]|uniref:thioredoxin-like n=1 Tax=Mya arenaria TaxID=6604 RepID=UPI0022E90736|nr:thioredoxin-like [Mya arenaria]
MVKFLETKADFDAALSAAAGKLMVVDFTASWCGPCKMIAPVFEGLSQEHADVDFYKVDVDANADTSESQGISCMPTFKLYKNGEVVDTLEGADKDKLKALIVSNK